MPTTIKPLGNRVLVKRSEMEKTKGGIFIPETAKEKPKEGEVISVGPGIFDDNGKIIPLAVKKGDRILFSSYAGTEVKQDEKEYLIMKDDEILGVIES